MKLRQPTEKLANCVWLARLVDKARLYQSGKLAEDYARVFCHPLATDGQFLEHFQLKKEEILAVIDGSPTNDEELAEWFINCPQVTSALIEEWNTLAPNLGKKGYPMQRGFQWALKNFYADKVTSAGVDSIFTAIEFDEK